MRNLTEEAIKDKCDVCCLQLVCAACGYVCMFSVITFCPVWCLVYNFSILGTQISGLITAKLHI